MCCFFIDVLLKWQHTSGVALAPVLCHLDLKTRGLGQRNGKRSILPQYVKGEIHIYSFKTIKEGFIYLHFQKIIKSIVRS